MTQAQFFGYLLLVAEYVVKIIAIGTVPENRRPSSSQAWLLIILLVPVVGVPLYLVIGSPYVRGRRNRLQARFNKLLDDGLAHLPLLPEGADASPELTSVLRLNRRLTGLPSVAGSNDGLFADAHEFYEAMAESVRRAEYYVHVEFYILSWDEATDGFFTALSEAVERGVRVRLLMDHLGSRGYPGWRKLRKRLTAAGIEWQLMMPIDLWRRRIRRPDLRNHRKLVVVDGVVGYIGSHNLIHPAYKSRRNERIGREWYDLSMRVSGDVVAQLESVFAVDWYAESGERLRPESFFAEQPELVPGEGTVNAMQLVPSGPGFPTEPNLRLFTSLVHSALERVAIASPYFVPDESLLGALSTAAYRGVRIDLFVGEEADQFVVGHAQRSYYHALLEAGVHIHLYPAPTVLHSKWMTVDDTVATIGSSNMDYRSFALDYEITLLGFDGDLVESLHREAQKYREVSHELTLEEWQQRPWTGRYVDNVCRLFSALM